MTAIFPDDPTDEPVDDTPPSYWPNIIGYVRLLLELLFRRRQEEGQDTPDGGQDTLDGGQDTPDGGQDTPNGGAN